VEEKTLHEVATSCIEKAAASQSRVLGILVTPDDIRGRSRVTRIAFARKLAAQLMKAKGLTHREIGHALGRDQSMAVYYCKEE